MANPPTDVSRQMKPIMAMILVFMSGMSSLLVCILQRLNLMRDPGSLPRLHPEVATFVIRTVSLLQQSGRCG
jgi:Na+-transporting methylmalonyl-CoA/oxaloacetate decarboxylase beta subunit